MKATLGSDHYNFTARVAINKKASWGETAGALHAVRKPALAE
jgi:hypothetical protein